MNKDQNNSIIKILMFYLQPFVFFIQKYFFFFVREAKAKPISAELLLKNKEMSKDQNKSIIKILMCYIQLFVFFYLVFQYIKIITYN